MAKIFFAFVETPGLFSIMIRSFLKQKYIHVVISLDKELNEAYSVGRRNPRIPIFAGFEKENKEKVLKAFPTANYCICEMECTEEQKENIEKTLREDFKRRFKMHYAIIGLPFILMNKPFYQKNHYTCSSYITKILSESGIDLFDKHFSLVTPKDFFVFENKKIIFEGSLSELILSPELNKVFLLEDN